MKAAIHALKYDRLHPAARGLGRMLAEAIAQLAEEAPADKDHLAWPGFDEVRCETRGASAVLCLTKFVSPSPDAE